MGEKNHSMLIHEQNDFRNKRKSYPFLYPFNRNKVWYNILIFCAT